MGKNKKRLGLLTALITSAAIWGCGGDGNSAASVTSDASLATTMSPRIAGLVYGAPSVVTDEMVILPPEGVF